MKATKSTILLTLVLNVVLIISSQGQGESRKTGDTATFDLPGGATIDMVWIEPGAFMRGSPVGDTLGSYDDEGPSGRRQGTHSTLPGIMTIGAFGWEAGTEDLLGVHGRGDSVQVVTAHQDAVHGLG